MFTTVLYKNHICMCGGRCVKGTLSADVACFGKNVHKSVTYLARAEKVAMSAPCVL